jgi:hypothetical protein
VTKKTDPVLVLKTVVDALEPLDAPDRQWVLTTAASRWSLPAPVANPPNTNPNTLTGGAQSTDVQGVLARKDARGFIRIKRPSNDVQRVACLGYYHVQTGGGTTFTSKELVQLNTASGGTNINIHRAVDNATRRAAYLSTVKGHNKQLTTLGEDVVNALPDQSKVTEIDDEASARRRGKRRRKGKSKKAS